MSRVIYCDKCKNPLKGVVHTIAETHTPSAGYDLCEQCYSEFLKFMGVEKKPPYKINEASTTTDAI